MQRRWRKVSRNQRSSKSRKFIGLRKFRSQNSPSAKWGFLYETILQPKAPLCEIEVSLRNKPPSSKSFRSHKTPPTKILAVVKPLPSTRVPFRSCEMSCKIPILLRNPSLAAKWPPSCEMSCEITFGLLNGYEITSKLWNGLQAAKLTCEMGVVCKKTFQSQWKLQKCQQSLATMHLKKRALCTLRSHTRSLSLHFWPP